MEDNKTTLASKWKKFDEYFQWQEIPARTLLLREGEVAERAYFIVKGCIRCWFNHDGKDITFQFFFEGDVVSSIESFRTGHPSLFNLETLEQCTIRSVTKANVELILESSPQIKLEAEENIFQRLLFYQKLFLSRIKDKPQDRYEELVRQHPEILQRVPQHYIASYLGITPVSLSRIRNRI